MDGRSSSTSSPEGRATRRRGDESSAHDVKPSDPVERQHRGQRRGSATARPRPPISAPTTPCSPPRTRARPAVTYTDAFTGVAARGRAAPEIVALTAAMPGPTVCSLRGPIPERFFDVGIAEQHELTLRRHAMAACDRRRRLLDVLQPAFDQANLDIGLHQLRSPCLRPRRITATTARASRPPRHGLCLSIRAWRVRPSSAEDSSDGTDGPVARRAAAIRFPKTPRHVAQKRSATACRPSCSVQATTRSA